MKDDKILKDEIMSEEELDQVAGGSWGESVRDFNNAFTRKIPGFENIDPMSTEGVKYMLQNWTENDNIVGKLKNMFASHGIEMIYNGKPFEDNIYKFNGKNISQDDAWKIIDGK